MGEMFKKINAKEKLIGWYHSGPKLKASDLKKNDGSAAEKTFIHVPSLIEAEEAEEIGVEHLLRDIRDQAAGNLSLRVTQTYQSLLGLHQKLRDIATYLEKVYNK